jgi:hypothetical protein
MLCILGSTSKVYLRRSGQCSKTRHLCVMNRDWHLPGDSIYTVRSMKTYSSVYSRLAVSYPYVNSL